jgi:hypothetical protein
MIEKRMKEIIHETLESGGGITHAKENDQEILVTPHEFEIPSWECRPLSYVSNGN